MARPVSESETTLSAALMSFFIPPVNHLFATRQVWEHHKNHFSAWCGLKCIHLPLVRAVMHSVVDASRLGEQAIR